MIKRNVTFESSLYTFHDLSVINFGKNIARDIYVHEIYM